MNGAHWHLVVNHLPIIFPIVGVIVMITGLISKSDAVKRMAFFIFMIGSISAIAAMTTGEGAEEIVENIDETSGKIIHNHEEIAETFAILSYILGAFSLFGLWASFTQKSFSNIANIVILLFAFVVIYFGKQTGTTGGEIRHLEIRAGYSGAPASAQENQAEEEDID